MGGMRNFSLEPTMQAFAPFPLQKLHQVGIVVRNLEASMGRYWEKFGVGPWQVYTYGPPLVKDMTYRGKRQNHRMRLAFAWIDSLMIELIQPLEGPNIYEEFLQSQVEGLHHVLTYVDDLDAASRDLQSRGYALIQSGRGYGVHDDGGYAYFDTTADLGIILEVAQLPKQRRPPDVVFPTPAQPNE
jgi:hypothetical protein